MKTIRKDETKKKFDRMVRASCAAFLLTVFLGILNHLQLWLCTQGYSGFFLPSTGTSITVNDDGASVSIVSGGPSLSIPIACMLLAGLNLYINMLQPVTETESPLQQSLAPPAPGPIV